MRWLLLGFLVAGGCAERRPSCDELAGVWHDADGRRYHASANASGYEVYAMFDSATPPVGDKTIDGTRYAPIVFDLAGPRDARTGRRTQRVTRGATVCYDERPLRVSCSGGELVLAYDAGRDCDVLGPLAPAATLRLSR